METGGGGSETKQKWRFSREMLQRKQRGCLAEWRGTENQQSHSPPNLSSATHTRTEYITHRLILANDNSESRKTE